MPMALRFSACACNGVRWARWACPSTKSVPANGSRLICWSAMMDCRKRCGCRNKYWREPRTSKSGDIRMSSTAFWERVKTSVRDKESVRRDFLKILLGLVKAGIAGIATAKISQQFGREEEKEK